MCAASFFPSLSPSRQGTLPHSSFHCFCFDFLKTGCLLRALARGGLTVIAEQRPEGADGLEYARRVVSQIACLEQAGVPDESISVVQLGNGHGLLYAALPEWLEPTLRWARGEP